MVEGEGTGNIASNRGPHNERTAQRARKQNMEEQENILDMVQRGPTTSTRTLPARIGVSRTRVWRTLHEDGLYLFHAQPVQNLHPGDSAMRLELCHWLYIDRQLLPLILFTDEATFTRNGIKKKTRNSHRWSQENPHGTVEIKFSTSFFSQCVVRYDQLHVDCSRYFRRSYDRTKLPRLSAK